MGTFKNWSHGPKNEISSDQIPQMLSSLRPVGPDAELIEACRRFVELELSREAFEVGAEKEGWAKLDATELEETKLVDAICRTSSKTADGVQAKALAIIAWDSELLEGAGADSDRKNRLLVSMLQDILS